MAEAMHRAGRPHGTTWAALSPPTSCTTPTSRVLHTQGWACAARTATHALMPPGMPEYPMAQPLNPLSSPFQPLHRVHDCMRKGRHTCTLCCRRRYFWLIGSTLIFPGMCLSLIIVDFQRISLASPLVLAVSSNCLAQMLLRRIHYTQITKVAY